ncbi:acyl-CoA dehydrogenase family protein [Dongia sedimenti]|uniref:Acyl-CoA dehydrogenase family protein n=1 Tax=Dongia sedimenti TaxID=3064282 RepID=A0ABU0YTD5_9PROT|nr:acyl-CoA dehydrogenase family protein [Rhodospirillaceae bacterium R-7]
MSAQTAVQAAGGTAASPLLPNLLERCHVGLNAAETIVESARRAVTARVTSGGKIEARAFDNAQFAAHGFAWLATYATALAQLLAWAERLNETARFGETEALILQIGFGEYLAQLGGGFPMSQGEIVRPADLGLSAADLRPLEAVTDLISSGNTADARAALAGHIADGNFGEAALDDESLAIIRDQFHAFAEAHREDAHQWHLKDALIPIDVIEQLAEMGVFGLTVPEDFGGSGLGKLAMCVVTEELSRGYIGLGSLGTRSEIAAELIRLGGTEAQKSKWLPKLASGEILPTAVFTEPNTGSDLGSLRTRAVKDGDVYKVTGNKTWITHAARSDVMTLLARTDPNSTDYRGLSMFIAEKPRGTEQNPFPAPGMKGGEIPVLGYRGMKEYELSFDGFEVKAENLLGGAEGEGFKQLMATFESARIQTAARAVGVAQCAMELGLKYARERIQFGKPIYAFPRISGKLAWMAVETMIARQLSYFAAREKDSDRRCDIPAGMAKLLAARCAWSNADNALQIHGGNGYAQEYPISRVLCDARILNIFEGAAEIQAQVVARGLLSGRN